MLLFSAGAEPGRHPDNGLVFLIRQSVPIVLRQTFSSAIRRLTFLNFCVETWMIPLI